VLQELAVRDATDRMGTRLAWYLDAFRDIALAKNLIHPPAHPGFPLEGDLTPPLLHHLPPKYRLTMRVTMQNMRTFRLEMKDMMYGEMRSLRILVIQKVLRV